MNHGENMCDDIAIDDIIIQNGCFASNGSAIREFPSTPQWELDVDPGWEPLENQRQWTIPLEKNGGF